MKIIFRKIINKVKIKVLSYKVRHKTKFFCIGRNKTGTTSLKKAFSDLGFIVGDQTLSEKLYDCYFFSNDFDKIVSYCETAEVFQDVPFSYFQTVSHIDKAYPNSKFILTIRDDAEQWYNSITKFHAKMFGKNGRIPNTEDLKSAKYLRKGFMYNTIKAHGTTDEDPYNKEVYSVYRKKMNDKRWAGNLSEYIKDMISSDLRDNGIIDFDIKK